MEKVLKTSHSFKMQDKVIQMTNKISKFYNRIFGLGFLMSAFIFAGLTSCSDDSTLVNPDDPAKEESGYITITINNSNLTTRAEYDEPGVTQLNENLIKSVTLCMSPSAGDRTDNDAPAFMQTFNDLDAKNGSVTLRIPLSTELENRLFNENSSESCNVFAAVNVDPGEAKTVADLRALAITSEFATEQTQTSFTMDGDAKVEYNRAAHSATSDIKVKRSAAKFTLALAVKREIKETTAEGEITWKPKLDGMSVMMQQGVGISQLDPKPEPNMDADAYFNSDNTLNGKYTFKYDRNAPETSVSGMKYKYDYVQNIPLYSYPNKWTGNEDERHGTYLLLVVPWSNDEGRTYRTCYYHVPVVPSGTYEIARNISYHINLHVGVLGSYVPEEPFEVEADYYVADWGSEDLNVDIKDYRYLVVDQNEYIVNNENSITIPFYTSHPAEVVAINMKFWRFNFSDEGTAFSVTVTKEMNELSKERGGKPVFTSNFDNTNNTLTVTHDLTIWQPYDAAGNIVDLTNNVESLGASRKKTQTEAEVKAVTDRIAFYREVDDDEYSMVEFEVTVQHSDVADGSSGIDQRLYKETVNITQFPGMYITAVQNNTISNAAHTTLSGNGAYGNTIINGRYDPHVSWGNKYNTGVFSQSSAYDNRKMALNAVNWDYSMGLSTENLNWNPNMYLVTITNLPENTEFIIDDPRSYYINNYLSNDNVDAQNLTPYPDQYWKRVYAGNYWNVEKLDNPTAAEIQSIMNGREESSPSRYNWTQGYKVDGFVSARALSGESPRTLRYYYPTREAKDNSNTVAPKFRICSSYGGTWAYLTREMARRRAAAYQELGYCAGRWRLPTFGEVKFVMELSRQNKIPRLFGRDEGVWYYWCAQGAVLVPRRGDTTTEIKIVTDPGQNGNPEGGNSAVAPFTGNNFRDHGRFVYDEWYWGSTPIAPSTNREPNETAPIYTFTWGDQQKTNPETPTN